MNFATSAGRIFLEKNIRILANIMWTDLNVWAPIKINDVEVEDIEILNECSSLELAEDEYIIYAGNTINQFNEFTACAKQLKDQVVALYISESLQKKLEIEVDTKVEVTANEMIMALDV